MNRSWSHVQGPRLAVYITQDDTGSTNGGIAER
jgi:hypothetical protein